MRFNDESVLLGAVMQDPGRRFAVTAVLPEHFSHPERSILWRATMDLADADEAAQLERPIHPDRLQDVTRGKLKDTNVSALFSLGNSGPAQYDYAAAGDRVIARWQLRAMKAAYLDAVGVIEQAIADDAPRAGLDSSELVVSAAQATIAAADPARGIRMPAERADDVRFMLNEARKSPGEMRGQPSGFKYWDRLHKGSRPGLRYLIAPTGLGKTSLLLNLGTAICDPNPWNSWTAVPGLYVNSEMPRDEIDTRSAAIYLSRAGMALPLDSIESGRLLPKHVDKADEMTAKSGLAVTEPAERTMPPILSMIGKAAIQRKVQWVGVDHLMDIQPTPREKRDASTHAAWPHHMSWMRRLKGLANRYGICIEVLGHTGRDDIDFKPGKEPQWKNMQGGSALLNVLDSARILWTDKAMGQVVSVTKNRGGSTGRISMAFDKPFGFWTENGKWTL